MILFLKGFIIGLGKVVPGVSGSLLAIRLNVYENMIYSINNLFNNFKDNFLYLLKIGIGILLAIILGSNMILYFLENFYSITIILFLMLILSGIPSILKETNNYLIAFFSFLAYISILYLPKLELINSYYFIGFLESFTTIVPGISGTAIYMSLGLYELVLNLFSNIHLFELDKLIPFGIGFLVGGLIIIKFISYCFNNYRSKIYGVILGLLIGSIFSIIIKR